MRRTSFCNSTFRRYYPLTLGVEVKDHAWIRNSIIGWRGSVGRWARVQGVTVTGDDVHLGDEIYVNGAKIMPHKSVSASVPNPKIIL
jgi:mannose-1-phosphate guanylyltransferase